MSSIQSCEQLELTFSAGMPPLRLLKPSGTYLKKKATRNLIMGILCLALFLVLFVTSIDGIPLYIDAGKYTTARGIALGLFIVGWYY